MSINLLTITTQYRRFTKNQVLTEGQLNEIVNFFDDQDRLTRICLSGVGNVCGFKISYNNSTGVLTITQGSGVTTDGDLFHLYEIDEESGEKTMDIESKQYTHYKIHDNEKANYQPFFYDGNDQLEIFELLTEEQQADENDDTWTIEEMDANESLPISNAVVLLYLETYEKEKDLCVSLSCDNQGLEMIGNYKVLLVSKEVAAQINSHDTIISKTNYSHLYHELPDVIANRVVLHPDNFIHYEELKRSFTNGTLRNNVVNNLLQGFQTLLTSMNMPVLLNSVENNINSLFNYTEDTAPPDFQYRYDVLKDIIDTYNEIKTLLFNLDNSDCCPNINSFPKHLMLGEVIKDGPCYEYRHAFYKSPLLKKQNLSTCTDCITTDFLISEGPENTVGEFIIDMEENEIDFCPGKGTDEERLFSLIKRAVQLLANYNANYNFIKIIPSMHLGALGKKAIPFYTNLGNHLIQLWDFDKTVLGKQRDNISYHNSLLNIKQPFEVCIDHNFYRIEGHQGRNYKEALEVIQNIRHQYGLGFNVIALSINATEAQEFVENFTTYYLNKNHGYEHKAGVKPGGTFIMIYVEGEYSSYPYPYGYGYPYGYPYYQGDSLAGDFEGEGDEEELVVLNPVVADFCLPYLCCGENLVALSLPVDVLCFNEETQPLPFNIMPTGGFVEAEVEEGLNGGVTQNEFGAFVFDPQLVSEELYGVPITFTVNNFDTDCQITIFREPQFNFEVESSESNETEATVVFNITGDDLIEGMEYTWNFGDGSDLLTSSETTVQHNYPFEALDGFTVTVTLSGGEGTCAHEVEQTITLDPPVEITASMDVTTICRNDNTEHEISITPNDIEVNVTGDGISLNNAGNPVFIATNVTSTTGNTITVFVNGNPSDLVITLQNPPTASFSATVSGGSLTLSNNSQNANEYRWVVAGEEIIRNTRSQVVRSIDNYDGTSIVVSLRATDNLCGSHIDGPRSVTIREIIEETECLQIAESFTEKALESIEQIQNSNIGGEVLEIAEAIKGVLEIVQSDTEAFTKGSNNNQLPDLFNREMFSSIFNAIEGTDSQEDHEALRELIEIYIGLFYTILRCQDANILEESGNTIMEIEQLINRFLEQLREIEFKADVDGTLKEFLESLIAVFEDSPFIVDEISNQLDLLS